MYINTTIIVMLCTRSVWHHLEPNIFSYGPPTQSISTYFCLCSSNRQTWAWSNRKGKPYWISTRWVLLIILLTIIIIVLYCTCFNTSYDCHHCDSQYLSSHSVSPLTEQSARECHHKNIFWIFSCIKCLFNVFDFLESLQGTQSQLKDSKEEVLLLNGKTKMPFLILWCQCMFIWNRVPLRSNVKSFSSQFHNYFSISHSFSFLSVIII